MKFTTKVIPNCFHSFFFSFTDVFDIFAFVYKHTVGAKKKKKKSKTDMYSCQGVLF